MISPAQILLNDNWKKRRLWMIVALLWLGGNAQYLMVWGKDTVINQNALVTLLGAFVSIIFAYVFGAVWDDTSKRESYSGMFSPGPPEVTPTSPEEEA